MNPAEAYILNQHEPFRSILLNLQSIIVSVAPEAELLYKWRIPFYYQNAIPLCFLNQSRDYVDLAFWHYDKMVNFTHLFIDSNRKHVRSLRFKSVEGINNDAVIYVLKKQLEINTNPFKLKR